MGTSEEFKVKAMLKERSRSAFRKYRDLCYGDRSMGYVLWAEVLVLTVSWLPGALGLALRKLLYPSLFLHCGRDVVFGRSVTLRHAHKISLGDRVILDDGCVVDAKGEGNKGIVTGDDVYIGRNSIVYCKNGDITLEDAVNISANCQVFSSNSLVIGRQTVIGAFTYILSGGEYDPADPAPFAEQSGTGTKGPLAIGAGCWIAAHVTIVDAASLGERCVVGAGAVVTKPLPARSLAVGVPARIVRHV